MPIDDDGRGRLEATYVALRRFAAVVGPVDVDPDDLVQEVFARVLRRGIDRVDDLDTYLRKAILNLSRNERRRWWRAQQAFRRHGVDEDAAPPVGTSVDVAELMALSPDDRAVLWLAEVEGWTHAEIGALLGCTDAAARMRATRARRSFRTAHTGEGT